MKKIILLLSAVTFVSISQAQVGINTNTPNSKSSLHVSEKDDKDAMIYKGVKFPSFTTAQRDANFTSMTAADNGVMIYNTTINCYEFY